MGAGPATALADPTLEARIEADLATIAGRVERELGPFFRALVLGGGYGRGEGGARWSGERWEPYNDYDLFVVVEGVSRPRLPGLRAELTALGGRLEAELGLEVELAPVRREDLPRLPFTMMWCELLGGHRVVAGEPAALAEAVALPPAELPRSEAFDYLVNRAALLLWAKLEDLGDDRTWKFVHKAWLAVAAAGLIAEGRFAVGYGTRQAALEGGAAASLETVLPQLEERTREAAEARLAPRPAPASAVVRERLEEAVRALAATWRWLEGGGAAPVGRRSWLNPLRQLRALGPAGMLPVSELLAPPRGRLMASLPGLLEGRADDRADRLLGLGSGSDHRRRVERWLALWRRA